MNKKALIVLAILAFSLLLTPIALATPGAEKSNEKFEYFQLVCSGTGDENPDRQWFTINPHLLEVPEEVPKTLHARGGGWVTGDTVELTVGSDTYTTDTTPVSVDWTTTTDVDAVFNNTGALIKYHVRLTDVVTVYENDVEIGTLVLELRASIVPARDPLYSGTVVGYGTGELKGVHISGIDVGLIGPELFMRVGTITGWPY